MGKVSASPLERGETTISARARGPAHELQIFADRRMFDTLERGEIIVLGLRAFREQRRSRQKPQGELLR
jgi:hypothetical protein